MPPVVCRFWQQGTCRKGDRCNFLHTEPSNSNPNQQPVGNNRYAALQNPDNSNPRNHNSNNGYRAAAPPAGTLPYSLDKNAILVDLISEKPQWILSAYGPGRFAPAQLFGGLPREQSFEEMRLLHYYGVAAGNPQQAVLDAEKLHHTSEQQIQNAVKNMDEAINFIINSEKDHPNRLDTLRESLGGAGAQPNPFSSQPTAQQAPTSTPNPFGAPSQQPASAFGARSATAFGAPSSGGAFGQPSALAQRPNAFGSTNTAFGAPSQPNAGGGAFGQPSALGQKPNPFGAPSVNASAPAAAPFSSFTNKPNPFGLTPTTSTAFGAPSQPAFSNVFGAPSQPASSTPLGAPSQPAVSNPFGAPSQPVTSTPFGAPSQPAQPNPFGQPSNPQPATNVFGSQQPPLANPLGGISAAPFGAPSPAKNAFGQSSTQQSQPSTSNPFGASAARQQSPFGAPSVPATTVPFGQPQQQTPRPTNPFGAPSSSAPAATNGFSLPAPQTQQATNGFGLPAPHTQQPTNGISSNPNASLAATHPALASYITRETNGRITLFKGKRVIYRNGSSTTPGEPGFLGQDGEWNKIWFPDGPPPPNKDLVEEDSTYDEGIEKAYLHVKQTGTFLNGMMPLVPPKREWCSWDF